MLFLYLTKIDDSNNEWTTTIVFQYKIKTILERFKTFHIEMN